MIYYMGMVGIAAFAVTGVMAAGKKNMDIFSIVLLGMITALGGGTIRDILIDANPVFWMADLTYLWVALAASVVAFFLIRLITPLFKLLLYVDAFGLALFTVLATQKTSAMGFSGPVAVLMGLVTGIAGGMIRDVLTQRQTLILAREFYATPALIGAICVSVLDTAFPGHAYSHLYATGLIFILRGAAIQWGLYYPGWLMLK